VVSHHHRLEPWPPRPAGPALNDGAVGYRHVGGLGGGHQLRMDMRFYLGARGSEEMTHPAEAVASFESTVW